MDARGQRGTRAPLRWPALIPLLWIVGCGGGSSSDSGSLNFGAVWQRPGSATPLPGTPGPTPGEGTPGEGAFGTTLPPSVTTVRIVFDSPTLRCCIAIQPSTVPPDPQTGRREVVLQPLPVGPAKISIFGYPSLTAPAPTGAPSVICPTQPGGVGAPCVGGGTDSPSFESDPTSLTIEPGAVTDVGEVPVRSVPFVIASSRNPAPEGLAPSPVEIDFIVVDAVGGIEASSVRAQVTDALGAVSSASLQLSPCDDRSDVACSPGGKLDVRGLRAISAAQAYPPGNTTVRVLARNLGAPPESVDTQWRFRAAAPLATASPTRAATATATAAATRTATPSQTASASVTATTRATSTSLPTTTATPSARPTATRTGSPTATASARPTPTGTDTPLPSPTITRTYTRTPTATGTVTLTRTASPTAPPCGQDAPQNGCLPGTRLSRHGCELEWSFSPPPELDQNGIPLRSIECHDGDPACDLDAKADNQCTFRLNLCINNNDPRLGRCSPSQLVSFEVREPNPDKPKDPADSQNASTLEGAAGSPGGFGVTVMRGGAVLMAGVPNDTVNLCSAPLGVVVPLGPGDPRTTGVRRLRLRTSNGNETTTMSVRTSCLPAAARLAAGGAAAGDVR